MKIFFLFLCFAVGGGSATATVTQIKPDFDKPARWYVLVETFDEGYHEFVDWWQPDGLDRITWDETKRDDYTWLNNQTSHAHGTYLEITSDSIYGTNQWDLTTAVTWDASEYPTVSSPMVTRTGNAGPSASYYNSPFYMGHFQKYNGHWTVDPYPLADGLEKIDHPWDFAANTIIKLQTGGKAFSKRQNLFCLTATGQEYQPSGGNFTGFHGNYYFKSIGNIPSSAITMDGKPLGSDGKLWRTYADNDERDITPRVKNKDFYNFTVEKQKYKLNILANGYPLASGRVRPEANYCVGEYIGFDQVFTPALPETPQYDPIQWVLGGTYVNTNIPPQYPDGSDIYTNNPAFLKSQSTHAWWIDGGYKPSDISATLGEGLTFANGQYVVISRSGKLTMHRPIVTMNSEDSIMQFIWHELHVPYDMPIDNWDYLKPSGCDYTVKVDSIWPFDGYSYITQTLNGRSGNAHSIFVDTHGIDALDNVEIYHEPGTSGDGTVYVVPGSSDNIVSFGDAPTQGCISNTWQHLTFTDYIRFKPNAGPGPNIDITLGIKKWYVGADSSLQTISGTTYMDYVPQKTISSGDVISTGTAGFEALTTDYTLAHWVRTAINNQINDF